MRRWRSASLLSLARLATFRMNSPEQCSMDRFYRVVQYAGVPRCCATCCIAFDCCTPPARTLVCSALARLTSDEEAADGRSGQAFGMAVSVEFSMNPELLQPGLQALASMFIGTTWRLAAQWQH